jgi:VanZ family protein
MFFAALALLVIGSLTPTQHLPAVTVQDKMLHFAAYALVTALAVLSFRTPRGRAVCLMLLALLGMSLEVAQMFVPGRSFELWDMAANGGGVLMAFQATRLLLP